MSKTSKMKKAALWLITVALAAVCFTLTPQNVEAAPKKKITLEKTKITMYAGEHIKVKVKSVTGLKSKKVTFSSTYHDVTKDGWIAGGMDTKKKITFTVTATSVEDPSVKATCKVTVKPSRSLDWDKIILEKDEITVKPGKKATIKVKKVKELSSKAVTYAVLDDSIAKVNSKGVITPKQPGKTRIQVASKTNPDTRVYVELTVLSPKVTHIDAPKNITLQAGYGTKLDFVKVQPNDLLANDDFTVTSSNPEVACITETDTGYGVLGASEGKATLTVKAKANKKVTAKIKVTVKKKVSKITELKVKLNKSDGHYSADYTANGLKNLGERVSVTPSKLKNKNLFWVSSNPTQVTVNQKGVVKLAKGCMNGTAIITVSTTDGSGLSYKIYVNMGTKQLSYDD